MPYTQPAATGTGSGSGIPVAVAGGTVDAITATFVPAITLADKTLCAVLVGGSNTIPNPTFNPNGLGLLTIVKRGGAPLVVGDIPPALSIIFLQYDLANTRWELVTYADAAAVAAVAVGITMTGDITMTPPALIGPTGYVDLGAITGWDAPAGTATIAFGVSTLGYRVKCTVDINTTFVFTDPGISMIYHLLLEKTDNATDWTITFPAGCTPLNNNTLASMGIVAKQLIKITLERWGTNKWFYTWGTAGTA